MWSNNINIYINIYIYIYICVCVCVCVWKCSIKEEQALPWPTVNSIHYSEPDKRTCIYHQLNYSEF